LGAEDARHLIESCALVQQIMHGATIAEDMTGSGQPRLLPPAQANGHANGTVSQGDGTTTVTSPDPTAKPVRPKWLKTSEAIAEAAARKAARKAADK
jgi:hypothetical protein